VAEQERAVEYWDFDGRRWMRSSGDGRWSEATGEQVPAEVIRMVLGESMN
jgi:hypothetical protein